MSETMKKNVITVIIILIGFLLLQIVCNIGLFDGPKGSGYTLAALIRPAFFEEYPEYKPLWRGLMAFIIIAATMALICPVRKIWSELGLGMKGFLKGWGIGIALCIPMFVTNAIAGQFVFSWKTLFFSALWPGFFEEVTFRAFPFGPLYRRCKWNFFLAIIAPTIVFASGHLYQSHDFISGLLTVAVTGIGALLFAWLYVEWDFNLWVPIALHAMMDAAWSLFPVGDESYGATGNTITNVGRAITIVLTIALTLWHRHNKKKNAVV